MQWPAFPSEADPYFQEMLAKALAVPGDASAGDANDAAPEVERAPAGHASDDAPLDLEACKQELREALEWARRNRHKWAGPTAAAPKKARRKAISTPLAKARSMLAARRHRGARRRPHRRARLLSRAGPHEGPAPDEPDALTTYETSQGGVPFGAAALHEQADVDASAAGQGDDAKASPPTSTTINSAPVQKERAREGGARAVRAAQSETAERQLHLPSDDNYIDPSARLALAPLGATPGG